MKKIISSVSIVALFLAVSGVYPLIATAATVSNFKDTMSDQTTSTTATHTITWTLVGGDTVAAGDTFTVDFVDADFTLNAIGNWQTSDFSFNDGSARTITAVSSSSGVDPTCTAGTSNVAVTINTSTNNFKVVACSTYTASSANAAITFTINGTTASGTGTMTNKATNQDSSLVALTQSNGDSSNAAVAIEPNGTVTVTATVNPTLTFSMGSSSISLGTLSSSSATTNASNSITVASNAQGGFIVTYNGPTLTSGANTITSIGTLQSSSTGTEQFGFNLKANTSPATFGTAVTTNAGTCGIATNYNTANQYSYAVSTTTTITNVTAPADCVYTPAFVSNIATTTEAGSYSAALIFVATGTF